MRAMRSKIRTFLAALAMVFTIGTVTPTPVAESQVVLPEAYANAEAAGVTIGAVSTDTGILVKYVGPTSGTVEVLAGGDVVLESVSGTPDVTTECPVSGALGGIIDVSDAACN